MQHIRLISIVKTLKIIQLYNVQSQNNTQHLFNENTSQMILQEKLLLKIAEVELFSRIIVNKTC